MKYFFVFAHPENEHSFQKSLLDHAIAELRAEGHDVRISDLYAMEFEPVASRKDFKTRRFPDRLQYDREQKFAVQNKDLPSDVAAELDNLFWCDVLVMQFPLYWFSMPAIMKGWVDRVFLNSLAYGAGMRFETGGFKGKRAMVCTSTGGFDTMFSADGLLGDMHAALWHIQHGMLHYTGFEVLPPFVAWAPVRVGDEQCLEYHSSYSKRLLDAATTKLLDFHNTADFGSDFKMRESITPKTIGHGRVPE
jgi:NAD(P)H dehydrogenase (quinone)